MRGTLRTTLAQLGVLGGSVYDALVGQAALVNRRALLTRDRRTERTYRAPAGHVPLCRMTRARRRPPIRHPLPFLDHEASSSVRTAGRPVMRSITFC
jgi:hypothetical protein